ncbi:MAG: nuclear transport factor 2 family protein [Candidatus Pedobacter colombiensis]|uniref:Nuclear transport factor 2 family protein n=1 Tax=Candidatus Pedobacter colombiensis TaxID=3121371 RepID=A0AAJ5W5R9_9SPHI|nr:nuclear transport factor 2 family protein [Pedobacter sp.]WEK17474.1 MAG: nuclear transport factor 2 family protein [Pedobacter sp.]
MKQTIILITFTIMSLFASAQSKDETKIAELTEKLRLAMISGNKADLESLVTPNLTYGHSNGSVQDKAAFVTALSTKASDFKTIELSEQSITVAGNTAIVRHILRGNTNDGGIPGKVNLGVVLVWEKAAGEWKLLARRSFKISY